MYDIQCTFSLLGFIHLFKVLHLVFIKHNMFYTVIIRNIYIYIYIVIIIILSVWCKKRNEEEIYFLFVCYIFI